MKAVTTIGLDIAKSVFQVHGVDAESKVAVRRQLKRARVLPFFLKLEPCVVGIEACASSHYLARELIRSGMVASHGVNRAETGFNVLRGISRPDGTDEAEM